MKGKQPDADVQTTMLHDSETRTVATEEIDAEAERNDVYMKSYIEGPPLT